MGPRTAYNPPDTAAPHYFVAKVVARVQVQVLLSAVLYVSELLYVVAWRREGAAIVRGPHYRGTGPALVRQPHSGIHRVKRFSPH